MKFSELFTEKAGKNMSIPDMKELLLKIYPDNSPEDITNKLKVLLSFATTSPNTNITKKKVKELFDIKKK
jgi:hypothetical protein